MPPSAISQPSERIYIPYVEGKSEAIRRVLRPYNIATSFGPVSTLKNLLTHLKDPLPEEEQSGIVYSISCTCRKNHYIGETGRSLNTRKEEHKAYVRKGEVEKSAIAEHAWNHGHQVDWNSAKALTINHTFGLENFWSHDISIYRSQE